MFDVGNDKTSIEDLKAEHLAIRRQVRVMAGVSFIVLFGGALFFHIVEKLNWVDAFYFCTITLTTVGYGDIVPKTDPGKIFDIFYVLIGIGIIATFANILIKGTIVRRQYQQAKRQKNK